MCHFLRQTSAEMYSVFETSGTENTMAGERVEDNRAINSRSERNRGALQPRCSSFQVTNTSRSAVNSGVRLSALTVKVIRSRDLHLRLRGPHSLGLRSVKPFGTAAPPLRPMSIESAVVSPRFFPVS